MFLLIILFGSSMMLLLARNSLDSELYPYALYNLENAFPNLSFLNPVGLVQPNDNSNLLYLIEQRGILYRFNNSQETTDIEIFLDITNQVYSGGELGLLGIAFHPNFTKNGLFFLDYTVNNPVRTIISRFSIDGLTGLVNTSSELIILEIEQPYSNHNGGQIAFGPDGYLYIALGDGGSGGDPLNHGQNRKTLLGSIIRINIDQSAIGKNYSIPVDNPFTNNTEEFREEIFAFGLRNPWRFSFDSLTGDLWAADVGQNEIEEIDLIENGGNYGWRLMEGTQCYNPSSGCDDPSLIPPIYQYDRTEGYSITGGFVYRGPHLTQLYGHYIYADYGSGKIWALNYAPPDISNYLLIDSFLNIVSFGVDTDQNIYILAFDGHIYTLNETTVPTTTTSTSIPKNPSSPTATISTTASITESNHVTPSFSLLFSLMSSFIFIYLVSRRRSPR
ncbi:MAG: PQQ-dependent sugar dehydrogenase [Candidatus Hodarchaeales archaeon]